MPLLRATLLMALLAAGAAQASPVAPLSYSMPNGDGQASGGSLNYWDRNYTGSGSTTSDGAALSGGLGKLTDGIIATTRWDTTANAAGTGEHVGWLKKTSPDPLITFNFAGAPQIDEIDIYLDDSGFGGVFSPSAILIDGVSLPFILQGPSPARKAAFTGLGLSGNSHTVQLLQQGSINWVFVSEIAFDGPSGASLPEPGALSLVGLGLAGLLLMRGRCPAA